MHDLNPKILLLCCMSKSSQSSSTKSETSHRLLRPPAYRRKCHHQHRERTGLPGPTKEPISSHENDNALMHLRPSSYCGQRTTTLPCRGLPPSCSCRSSSLAAFPITMTRELSRIAFAHHLRSLTIRRSAHLRNNVFSSSCFSPLNGSSLLQCHTTPR